MVIDLGWWLSSIRYGPEGGGMTTPHHHHWLAEPYGIFFEHPLSARGEQIDDPNYYMPFAPFGPPCTLPCKDEVWT